MARPYLAEVPFIYINNSTLDGLYSVIIMKLHDVATQQKLFKEKEQR